MSKDKYLQACLVAGGPPPLAAPSYQKSNMLNSEFYDCRATDRWRNFITNAHTDYPEFIQRS